MNARFPTVVLMLDLCMQILIMVTYMRDVDKSLDQWFDGSSDQALQDALPPAAPNEGVRWQSSVMLDVHQQSGGINMDLLDVSFLYIGATYFLLRELMQGVSLILSQSEFLEGWRFYLTDCLNICYIAAVYAWGIILDRGLITDLEVFSTAAALSIAILWMKFFAFLRLISFDFSVFISGVFFVTKRLVCYIICLLSFLFAFAQIFHTIFFEDSDYGCPNDSVESETLDELKSFGATTNLPFCSLWGSFLKVYTMFLGEVNDDDFKSSTLGIAFFSIFMLLVIIFLANVLIAVVTGYYKMVQDQHGALVFYTNRLYFLAEVYAIVYWFPCVKKKRLYGEISEDGSSWEGETWHRLGDVMMMQQPHEVVYRSVTGARSKSKRYFHYEIDAHKWNHLTRKQPPNAVVLMIRYVTKIIFAVLAFLFILGWFLLEVTTFGLAWQPQVKEWIFSNKRRIQSLSER